MTEDFNPTEWITTKEAAELTEYTQSYICKAVSRGLLVAEKIGSDRVLRKEDVLEYADRIKELGPVKCDPSNLVPRSLAGPRTPTKQR